MVVAVEVVVVVVLERVVELVVLDVVVDVELAVVLELSPVSVELALKLEDVDEVESETSLDAALDWAARCPAASAGAVEVRPLAPEPKQRITG